MLGTLVLFAFVFLMVLAFSSGKKQTRVTRTDPATGTVSVEIHETVGPNVARTAARAVVYPIIVVLWVSVIAVLVAAQW